MKVYFYHTQNLNAIEKEWREGRFPAHLLYGATHLPANGIETVLHKFMDGNKPRLWRAIYTAWQILTCNEHIDAVYGTRHNGLELLILLRAMHLYRKPIVIWHHQPIERSQNRLKEIFARFFYSGIDHMFFFSEHLKEKSLQSGRVTTSTVQQCPWGADLDFYERLMQSNSDAPHTGFISTGKERRDFRTLLKAFGNTPDQHLDLYAVAKGCGLNYEKLFHTVNIPDNVHLSVTEGRPLPEFATLVWQHNCICICCLETNYTVGLTTLVEALAFGLPVIISKNPNQPFDASEEKCGISVPYGDAEGWEKAIRFIAENPDEADRMGRRAREMAEHTYNVENCARIVAAALKKTVGLPDTTKADNRP